MIYRTNILTKFKYQYVLFKIHQLSINRQNDIIAFTKIIQHT